MALQTGQFKSQSIIESVLKSLLSLFFSIVTMVLFIVFLSTMGINYNLDKIFEYTIVKQLPTGNLDAFFANFAQIIWWSIPLILTGLSVAIAFKCGLFNIGGQGQMVIGGLFAGIFGAVIIPQTPLLNTTLNSSPIIMIPTIVIISMVAGAIWAGIPGLLRAYTGAHEVITTIFMNQIAINLANFLVGSTSSPFVDKRNPSANVYGQTAPVAGNAQILPINFHFNIFGFNLVFDNALGVLNWSIFLVLLVVIVTHYLIWNTNFGYKIRATGYNKVASETSGIDTRRSILYAMLIAGALSGLAGGLLVIANSSSSYAYIFGNEGTAGFDGIAVSLIGLNSPFPIILAALLFGLLRQGRLTLDTGTNISSHIIVILQSFVVLFAAAPYMSTKLYGAVKDSAKDVKNAPSRLSIWYRNNKQAIISSTLALIIPFTFYYLLEIFKINVWSFFSFLSILLVPRNNFWITNITVTIALIVFMYSTYKYIVTYVSKQKEKSTNFGLLITKLVILFLIAVEILILFLYGLVTLSGVSTDIIEFHVKVLNVMVSPVTIKASIVAAFPIIMGAMGGAFNERAGIINIGLEGIMLTSAFGSVYFTYVTGNPYMGVFGGLLFGFLTALLHAVLTITFKAEQVVTGVGINLLALGLTDFFTDFVWSALQSTQVNKLPLLNLKDLATLAHIPLQDLFNIPFLGNIFQILATQSILLFIGLLLIPICHIVLFKTPFGLRLRVIGEEPSAAATAGISVKKYQYIAVLISGLLTSIGGVYLAIGDSAYFKSGMTGGRGYTALAAMIFGKWTISGGVLSGLFFGYFYALSINLNAVNYFSSVYKILQMIPYIIAIMVLAGAIGLARPPKSIGKPYDPQD